MSRRLLLPTVLATLAAACGTPEPVTSIRVSGHVEATETRLAPDAGGRVLALDVKEGDRIAPGDPVVRLDATDIDLAITRARAERDQADAQLRLLVAGARREDIRQAEAQAASARADVEAARAELASAEQDLRRFEALVESNSGSRKQRDDAATRR
ncbi:MAG: HlyD family secretion protein, partial [Vicinamibacterales bacterium]